MGKDSVVGNYTGNVQMAEGYHTGGVFYDAVNGEVATLDDVTTCTCLTLKIQVQKCDLIWGTYEYYNSLESKMDVDDFHGVRIADGVWQVRDGSEVITLTFSDCGKKVSFKLNHGDSSSHTARAGFFEQIAGCLKKNKNDCC